MGICPRTPTRAYTHIRTHIREHIRTHTRLEGSPDLLRLSAGGEGVKVAGGGRGARFHGYEFKKAENVPESAKIKQKQTFFRFFLIFYLVD